MFSKPLHPITIPRQEKKVSFALEKNEIIKAYPSKYIRGKIQTYPEEQERFSYDRTTFKSKRKYTLNYYKIIENIKKADRNYWMSFTYKRIQKQNKNKRERQDILMSKKTRTLWGINKKFSNIYYNPYITEPISSDSSDDEDNDNNQSQ